MYLFEEEAVPDSVSVPRPVALQLYSLREAAAHDFVGTLTKVSEIGFVGVELAGLHGRRPESVRSLAQELGLELPVAHIQLSDESAFLHALDDHVALGVPAVVCSGSPDDFASADAVAAVGERFRRARGAAEERNLALGYHNHWWEFDHEIGGRLPYDVFLDEIGTDSLLEIDVYWAVTAGVDCAKLLERLGKSVRFIHVKDGPARVEEPMVAAGSGSVDLGTVLKSNPNVEWHIVELDRCATDMLTAIKDSYEYLVTNGLSQGRASGLGSPG